MNELLLRDLAISGFRAFDNLTIEKLGRVNLIAGRNSVGKSSLLEALWMYARRGDPSEVLSMLESRDEGVKVSYTSAKDADWGFVEILSGLFFGRPDLREKPGICSIGPAEQERILRIAIREHSAKEESSSWLVSDVLDVYEGALRLSDLEYVVAFGSSYEGTSIARSLFQPYALHSVSEMLPCMYSAVAGMNNEILSLLWDLVALTELEKDVLNALRLVVPTIDRIGMIGQRHGRRPDGPVPIARLSGSDEPVPLRSLGDGVIRLFGIALALANARNGFLLIDEIENGLHHSIQAQVWKLIFTMAHRLNVQVFATTHSWDCIEAFQKAACEDVGSEGLLIRLENKKGRIVPTIFDESELAIATREHIEVR